MLFTSSERGQLLREEQEYQHHKSEESRVQLRKRKKMNDDIDATLELLLVK
jgi:hypothetical protein